MIALTCFTKPNVLIDAPTPVKTHATAAPTLGSSARELNINKYVHGDYFGLYYCSRSRFCIHLLITSWFVIMLNLVSASGWERQDSRTPASGSVHSWSFHTVRAGGHIRRRLVVSGMGFSHRAGRCGAREVCPRCVGIVFVCRHI